MVISTRPVKSARILASSACRRSESRTKPMKDQATVILKKIVIQSKNKRSVDSHFESQRTLTKLSREMVPSLSKTKMS